MSPGVSSKGHGVGGRVGGELCVGVEWGAGGGGGRLCGGDQMWPGVSTVGEGVHVHVHVYVCLSSIISSK
jgi:hypothetical protein